MCGTASNFEWLGSEQQGLSQIGKPTKALDAVPRREMGGVGVGWVGRDVRAFKMFSNAAQGCSVLLKFLSST